MWQVMGGDQGGLKYRSVMQSIIDALGGKSLEDVGRLMKRVRELKAALLELSLPTNENTIAEGLISRLNNS